METNSRWQCDRQQIAAKVVDGEAILIHITTGIYHSMDKVGGFLWGCLERGQTLQECAGQICERYEVDPEQALVDVKKTVESLVAAELVEPRAGDAAPDLDGPAAELGDSGTKLAYETPCLQDYDDMSDLLALDPPMPGMGAVRWDEADSGE